MRILLVAAVVPLLLGNQGGCGMSQQPEIKVVADSYCLAAKKRTWSVNDTQESIDEAIRINAGIDRACGRKG